MGRATFGRLRENSKAYGAYGWASTASFTAIETGGSRSSMSRREISSTNFWRPISGRFYREAGIDWASNRSRRLVHRLRWLMVLAMLFDRTITSLGQPSGFWRGPSFAREGNIQFRWLLVHGPAVFLPAGVCYVGVMFLLVAFLPSPVGFGVVLFNVMVHFAGGTSWLTRHFAPPSVPTYGACGGVLAVSAVAMASCGLPGQ